MNYNLKIKQLKKNNNQQFKIQRQIIVIMIKRRIVLKLKNPIMIVNLNRLFQKLMNKYNSKYFRHLNLLKKLALKTRYHIVTLIKCNKLKTQLQLKIKLMSNQLQMISKPTLNLKMIIKVNNKKIHIKVLMRLILKTNKNKFSIIINHIRKNKVNKLKVPI
jgi:hypothetical protein